MLEKIAIINRMVCIRVDRNVIRIRKYLYCRGKEYINQGVAR